MMRNFWWSVLVVAGLSWGCGDDTTTGQNPNGAAGAPTAGTGTTTAGTGPSTPDSAGRTSAGASGTGTTGTSGTSGGKAGTSATPPAAGTAAATAGTGTAGMPATAGMGTATAGMSAMPAAGTGAAPIASSCGPETMNSAADLGNMMKLGPFMPAHVERTGPSGSSWIFHPMELGKDGLKHPVFQWGPGAGTTASNYLEHLNLLASHGFVIISQASTQSGKAALDWILAENGKEGSMWYQKLDPDRVGRGGHSMGALQSMSEADDDRLKLYVLVCGGCMSGNGGCGAEDIDNPAVILGGTGLGDTRNFEGDYAEMKGPSVFVRHSNTSHVQCARDNMGPWVAFMRWQFCGEEKWKKEFESGGTYCMAPWDACESKNLP
jgi:hypothetical protein